MSENHRVFVYGTLRKGCHNHHLLETSIFKGAALLKDFRMVDIQAYPAIFGLEDGASVVGEIYECTPATLARLDRLEGYDEVFPKASLYMRIPTQARLNTGEVLDVETYVWPYSRAEGWPVIQSGNWVKHKGIFEEHPYAN